MSDLRGQKLKDSYQNVVTRGTGNKLEDGNGVEFADLDDKASLSGGADADFTTMPQVGGSPIVERGSNSDGEWVRFADGTVIMVRLTTYDSTNSNLQDRNYPLQISSDQLDTIRVSFGLGLDVTANNPRRDFVDSRFGVTADSGATRWRMRGDGNGTLTNISVSLTAIGRWE